VTMPPRTADSTSTVPRPVASAPPPPVPAQTAPAFGAMTPMPAPPATGSGGVDQAYRQALAQTESAQRPTVVPSLPPPTTMGLAVPRSRVVYDARALATIPFGAGSTKLSNQDMAVLREVAQVQRDRGGLIRVIGHAVQEGRTGANARVANFRVSGERADAVAGALVRLGVPAAVIEVEALGDAEPILTALGQADAAPSRRVEIHLE